MGEFSVMHWVLLGGVVILFFGPSRLPKAGQAIGEAIRGFKKGMKGDEIDVTEQSRKANLNQPQEDPLADSRAQKQREKTRQDS